MKLPSRAARSDLIIEIGLSTLRTFALLDSQSLPLWAFYGIYLWFCLASADTWWF